MSRAPNAIEPSEQTVTAYTTRELTPDAPAPTLDVDQVLMSDPNGPEGALLARAIHFAPWYVAIATATTLWWSFLVAGEFVLFGLPESLAAIAVLSLGGAHYWTLERRFSAYMPMNTSRQRLTTVLVIVLLFLLVLGVAMVLGVLVPESFLTTMLFGLVAGVALWQRRTRMTLYTAVAASRGLRVILKLVLASITTVIALIELLTRQ
ncbi:MAG TPA: hypothetical protein VIV60_37055 [Polyangiaceae bacterium]